MNCYWPITARQHAHVAVHVSSPQPRNNPWVTRACHGPLTRAANSASGMRTPSTTLYDANKAKLADNGQLPVGVQLVMAGVLRTELAATRWDRHPLNRGQTACSLREQRSPILSPRPRSYSDDLKLHLMASTLNEDTPARSSPRFASSTASRPSCCAPPTACLARSCSRCTATGSTACSSTAILSGSVTSGRRRDRGRGLARKYKLPMQSIRPLSRRR
jgi:hypothetical protein